MDDSLRYRFLLLLAFCLPCSPAISAETHFDLPAGPFNKVILEWSHQAGIEALFLASDALYSINTNTVIGEFEPAKALGQLLKGTRLTYDFDTEHSVVIKLSDVPLELSNTIIRAPPRPIQVEMPEVLVATERLLQARLPGEPVLTFDRSYGSDYIGSTGALSIHDLVSTIPQVFGGGPQEYIESGLEASFNSTLGSGINLRGMDAGEALVLWDGVRLARGGTRAEYADTSMIPLSMISRMEIIPDGSCTPCGADAVSGVINFVSRHVSGAESQARVSVATQGGGTEKEISQLLGTDWSHGGADLALELYQRNALRAADRPQATSDFSPWRAPAANLPYGSPGNILVGNQTWAVLSTLNGHPTLGPAGSLNTYDQWDNRQILPWQERVSTVGRLFFDVGSSHYWLNAWFSRRHATVDFSGVPVNLALPSTNPGYINPTGGLTPVMVTYRLDPILGPFTGDDNVFAGAASAGAQFHIAGWDFDTSISLAQEREEQLDGNSVNSLALTQALNATDPTQVFNPFGSLNQPSVSSFRQTLMYESHSKVSNVDMSAQHRLWRLPGGESAITIGGEYRQEALNSHWGPNPAGSMQHSDDRREVSAGFVQLGLPIVSPANRLLLLRSLDLTMGERWEHYSDGGGVWSPKVVAAWSIVQPLTLRGSWGRSYRAPALTERQDTDDVTYAYQNSLVMTGSNPSLGPESARTWTAGLDADLHGVSISATYFNIVSSGRVLQPLFSGTLPGFFGPVITSPSQSQQNYACKYFYGGATASCEGLPIATIIDERLQNLQTLETSGVDTSIQYGSGDWNVRIDSTYLLRYAQQLQDSAVMDLLDTPNYPVRLRARGSLSRTLYKRFSAMVAVNYTARYTDTNLVPSRRVGDWTTLDLGLQYDWFSINVRNLTDRMAPFVADTQNVAAWDSANGGNLIGRTVSAEVRWQW